MNYALREALAMVVAEGLEARIARHVLNGRALQAGIAAMDLSLATAAGHVLPQLACVKIPMASKTCRCGSGCSRSGASKSAAGWAVQGESAGGLA